MNTRFVHNQENLKEKIICTAKAIIVGQGLSALSIRGIAKKSGCAVGMVYKVLKGIDDIIIHINALTLDDLGALLKKVKNETEDREAVVYELAYTYYNFHKTNPHLWSALFEHNYDKNFAPPAFYEKKIETIFSIIEEAFLPCLNDNAKTAYTNARVLWAGVHGICTLSLCGSLSRVQIRSAKELIDKLVSNCLFNENNK